LYNCDFAQLAQTDPRHLKIKELTGNTSDKIWKF
jgi:hypothetical protein